MFCPNCGTKTTQNSQFCASCGSSLNISTKAKVAINSSETTDFILTITQNPLSACKDFQSKLSTPFVLTYFALIAILFSLINSFSLKSIFSQYFNQLIKLFSKLEGRSLDPNDLYEMSLYINRIKETLFPFSKSFSWFLTFSLTFYITIILLSYVYHNIILKTEVKWKNYFIVASVALTIQVEISLIALIASFFSLYLTLAILMLSAPLLIIILYKGFSNFIENKATYPYFFACIYAIANMLSSVILMKLITSHFINLSIKGFSDILSLF